MSSVSEQDHLNPRDPRYYAPRWLRERSASFRDADPGTSLAPSPVNFDSRLENAVSDALRHPLDPEVMREPEQEKALWSVAARFATTAATPIAAGTDRASASRGTHRRLEITTTGECAIVPSLTWRRCEEGRTRA